LKLSNTDDWEEISKFEKKGIKAYKKIDDASNILYIKSVGIINSEIKKVYEWVFDPKTIPDTDPMFKSGEIVEQFDEDSMIYFGQWSLPWPMWHRDFIYLWSKEFKDGIGIMSAGSIIHPKFPEGEGKSKSHVRGEIIETGFIFKTVGKPEDNKYFFFFSNILMKFTF
jgi:hypothetical protein